jgi:flagellar biosynthesis protein FlhB
MSRNSFAELPEYNSDQESEKAPEKTTEKPTEKKQENQKFNGLLLKSLKRTSLLKNSLKKNLFGFLNENMKQ